MGGGDGRLATWPVKLFLPSDKEMVGAPIERAIVVLKPVSADLLTNSQHRTSTA